MRAPDIIAINKGQRLAMLDNDEVISIQGFMDESGEECGPDEAIAFIAGPTAGGKWLSALVGSYQEVALQ